MDQLVEAKILEMPAIRQIDIRLIAVGQPEGLSHQWVHGLPHFGKKRCGRVVIEINAHGRANQCSE